MKETDAAEFQEQCLALFDELGADGLVVKKNGEPIARVIPYGNQGANLISSLRHKTKIRGNVYSTGLNWDVSARS